LIRISIRKSIEEFWAYREDLFLFCLALLACLLVALVALVAGSAYLVFWVGYVTSVSLYHLGRVLWDLVVPPW